MIELHITDELLFKLKRFKSYKTYNIVLTILKHGFISAEDLSKETGQALNYIEDMLSKVEYLKIIQKQIDEHQNTFYTAHMELVNANFVCNGCKYAKTVKAGLEGFKTKIIACSLQKKKIECKYNGFRKLKALRVVNRKAGLYENVSCMKKVVAKDGKITLNKKLEEWTAHDFADFFYIQFNERFQKKLLTRTNKMQIKQKMNVLYAYFVEEYAEDANFYLRQYIDYQFITAEQQGRMVSLAVMASVNCIREFANTEAVVKTKRCGKHNIYCPYWKKNDCQAGVKCTKRLRSKIKKTYN